MFHNKTLNINLIVIIIGINAISMWTTQALASQQLFDKRKKLWPEQILEPTGKERLLDNSVLRNSYNTVKNITSLQYLTLTTDKPPWQLKEFYNAANVHPNNDNILRPTSDGNELLRIITSKQKQKQLVKQNQTQATPPSFLSNIKIINSSKAERVTPDMSSAPSSTTLIESESELNAKNSTPPFSTSSSLSYFERVEFQESLTQKKNDKLLLHRNKRYLLFPEGSSFQLVFDLIIPIVDYTNFAIMGITCAVAWELPSKPPSEIIENFRTKLNDGTFGLSRRNDSTQQPLEYINSRPPTEQDDVDDNRRWSETVKMVSASAYNSNYQPSQQQRLLSAAVATTSGNKTFIINSPNSPRQIPVPPTTASNNFYYNHNSIEPEKFQQPTAAAYFYNQQLEQQKWSNYNNNVKTFDANQRRIFYASNDNGKQPIYRKNNFTSSQPNNYYKYNNNNNNNYKTYSIAAASKWNVENWQTNKKYHQLYQQHPPKYPLKYIQKQQQYNTRIPYNDAGDYWNKCNWWNRNRNRIEKQWQENQQKWSSHHQENQQNYQMPTLGKRTGRYRKILEKPPKHRVYPVFGKRRRRRSSTHLSDKEQEKKLQNIHTGEHLQTRQKLYGKIEKLYKIRGQNGTACVLRALCETERIHLNAHYHEAPQSFVMELLRSIFALPKDILAHSKDSSLHLDARYTNAVLLAHDTTQNCNEQYCDCEYRITIDA